MPCRLKLPLEIPQSSTLNHPIQAKTPKKRWSVHVRTCTDAPHCFVEATYHIGLCSRNKFEHNQFSRSQDIEARCARAHVPSNTPWQRCQFMKTVGGGGETSGGPPRIRTSIHTKNSIVMFLIEFRLLCFCYSVKPKGHKRRHSY